VKTSDGGYVMTSKYPGKCRDCGARIPKGATVIWYKSEKAVVCEICGKDLMDGKSLEATEENDIKMEKTYGSAYTRF